VGKGVTRKIEQEKKMEGWLPLDKKGGS